MQLVLLSLEEVFIMNRTRFIAAILSLAFPLAGMAQPTTQPANVATPMSSREAQSLMKSAHSSAQYKQLAEYFNEREAEYRAKAAAEKIERDRRAQVNAGLYQKYPRPVDSAQNLYESYVAEADSAAQQAHRYAELAATEAPHNE
jgi:hypothetical protein